MNKFILVTLVSLFASSSFAGTKLVCANSPFSKLTVELKIQNSDTVSVEVLRTSQNGGSETTPEVGEKALLSYDDEASGAEWDIFQSSSKGFGQRGYQVNILKSDLALGRSKVRAFISVSLKSTDAIWHAYEMTCTRSL